MVLSLHQLGKGIPDLLVQINDNLILVEVKQNAKSKFTPDQKEFYQSWKVYTVTSPEEVVELVNKFRLELPRIHV